MIVPMKKVSLVVLEKEKKQALEKLRKLKLVHVEDLTGKGENLSKLKSTYDMMERAFFLISDIKVKEKDVIQVSLTKKEAVEKASQFLELLSLKKNYEDLITGNTKEIERFSRWGDVDPADLRFLAEKGYFLFLYEIPAEYYSLIPETEKVLKDKISNTYYEVLELIYFSNLLDVKERIVYQKRIISKIKMIDFYFKIACDKKYISYKKYLKIGKFLLNIIKQLYGWIRYEKSR